ncbi:Angiopoietin-related protein 2 [Holothuria leucospilota]|uniref:Angiopoietin-related protein 2 n=1 Tax=Holothuria leucospilota TaxID=206669 RepID=A0A9Q1H5W2_HOLLE|nr:Angiopoietin-related protein 2 [Holothuria leucospilota]
MAKSKNACKHMNVKISTMLARTSAVVLIYPDKWPDDPFQAFCEVHENGEVWTVFQRRMGGLENFFRNWTSYKVGFGATDDEFWLGNEKLFFLTNQYNVKLRIDLRTIYGSYFYAEYDSFLLANESTNYTLTSIGIYSGNACLYSFYFNLTLITILPFC